MQVLMDRGWLGGYQAVLGAILEDCAPLTRAIWVNGSRAVGRHEPESDLDLVLVVEDQADIPGLELVLARHLSLDRTFPDYFTEEPVPLWMAGAGEVGIHIDIPHRLRNRVDAAARGPEALEAHQAFLQHKLVNASPAHDPGGLLIELQEQCDAVPACVFDAVADRHRRLVEQKVRWWTVRSRWKSSFEALSDLGVIVQELAQFHYALNRAFLMPGLKHYRFDLQQFHPRLEDDFARLLALPPASGAAIRTLVREIFDQLCMRHDDLCRQGGRR